MMTPEEVTLEVAAGIVAEMSPKSRIRKMWDGAPRERQKTMAQAIVFQRKHLAGPEVMKGPTPELTAKLILGARLADLNLGLTKAEGGQFITQNKHDTPIKWLWDQVSQKHQELDGLRVPNSMDVVRWVNKMMSSPPRKQAMLRDRQSVFGGYRIEGRVIDRIDEIKSVDLCGSPWRTIENAVVRAIEEEWSGEDELVKPEPWYKVLPEGVRVLNHYSLLRQEGMDMSHCVASYAEQVHRGDCVILSVKVGDERSTAEIKEGRCVQHVGIRNGSPPAACVKVVDALVDASPWNSRTSFDQMESAAL